jgi:DNA-binding HxlR family transcriptional regulator
MPKPAKTMPKRRIRGSRTGRPIMVLLDLLGRRWTLRIMWELREGALTSRALRTACDEASPTVLNERLKELREAGFVELADSGGYSLTPLGRELNATSLPLYHFAERWRGK